ncbi:Methyl-accepting chemotaxis protein [Caldanaerobius fijiensis DSM 17918]|uniref:Methyl-accepting chemotaxis protein n=1 Tax=Caldanaerobius fijiensis DSM 17918 TaxID=1121256 RepID=A0A1M4X557_9THEO|nr:methyl-accepting chemotaxis protein [Caldanaerobius fijiensis]SHE88600.1 Methyl-accepting chemotaxis protein [Caldanaerobius fijiensis DSM 17918]
MSIFRSFNKRVNIQWKLVVMFSALIIIVLTLTSGISYYISSNTIKTLIKGRLLNSEKTIIEKIALLEATSTSKDLQRKLDYSLISEKVSYNQQGLHPYIFIMDRNGDTVKMFSSNKDNNTDNNTVQNEIKKRLQDMFKKKAGITNIGEGRQKLTAAFGYIVEKDQLYIIALKDSEYLAPVNKIRNITLLLIFFSITLVIAIAWIGSLIGVTRPINKLLTFLSRIDKDNLNERIDLSDAGPEFALLGNGINKMIGNIESLIDEIGKTSDLLVNEGRELQVISKRARQEDGMIIDIIKELRDHSENQNHIVNDTVSMSNNMMSYIMEIITQIHYTAKISADLVEQSKNGLHALGSMEKNIGVVFDFVNRVVKLSKNFEQSIKRINDIATIIRNISNQIHMISLNASIQAAKASNYGYGFSVVAQEIRELSQKTTSSVEDVNSIVNSVIEDMMALNKSALKGAEAVKLSDKTIEDVNKIFQNINSYIENTENYIASMESRAKLLIDLLKQLENMMKSIQINTGDALSRVSEVAVTLETHGEITNKLESKASALLIMAQKLNQTMN